MRECLPVLTWSLGDTLRENQAELDVRQRLTAATTGYQKDWGQGGACCLLGYPISPVRGCARLVLPVPPRTMCIPNEKTTFPSPVSSPCCPKMATPTLHNFPLLPPELRNIIWELSLPEARVFDIYPASDSQKTPAHQGLRFANLHSEPPPPLAAVCRESRSLALHHYRPLTLAGGTTKYVDLERDVLLLESCLLERNLLRTLLFLGRIPLVRDNLRSLAFGTSYGVHTGLWHPVLGWKKLTRSNMGRFLARLGAFPALERLVFVLHQEVQLEVAELPRPRSSSFAAEDAAAEGCSGARDGGRVLGNATLYASGTRPPVSRAMLMMAGGSDDMDGAGEWMPRASTPTTPSSSSSSSSRASSEFSEWDADGAGVGESTSCRVPWTSEKPWLPHANEIIYYPAVTAEDDDYRHQRSPSPEGPRLRGPVPTGDDWLRFRRAFKREMQTGFKLGLADTTTRMGPCGGGRRKRKLDEVVDVGTKAKRPRSSGLAMEGYRTPAIEGANLLWRYMLPNEP